MLRASPFDTLKTMAKRLTGRSMLLSYPKCGRTWILNVFVNYWWRTERNGEEPLPYVLNCRSGEALEFAQKTGIRFTHGGKLRDLRQGSDPRVPVSDLRALPTTLLVRNPVSVLVSYYHHQRRSATGRQLNGSLVDFALGPAGAEALARYYNFVVPHILRNPRAHIATYEELHRDSQSRDQAFKHLLSTHFQRVDRDALKWAVAACEPEELRARSRRENTRVRKAQIIASDDLLTDELRVAILDSLYAKLDRQTLETLEPLFRPYQPDWKSA